MRIKPIQINYLDIAICLFAINIFVPAYQYYVPSSIRYLILFISFGFYCLTLLKLPSKIFQQAIISVILIALLTFLVYMANFIAYTTFIKKLISMFEFWYGLLLANALLVTNNCHRKTIFRFVIFLLIFTSITTINGNIIYPHASRILAQVSNYKMKMEPLYNKTNIGNFGFAYSLVLTAPLLLFIEKKERVTIKKFVYYAIIALFIYCLVMTEYTIGIILVILYSLVILLIKEKNIEKLPRYLLLGSIVCILLLFLFGGVVSDAIKALCMNIDSTLIRAKLYSISEVIAGSGINAGTDFYSRMTLYIDSFKCIFKYPLVGSWLFGAGKIGGHSEILDLLGGTGIIGLFSVLYIVRTWWRNCMVSNSNELKKHVTIVVIIMLILSFLNPVFSNIQLGFTTFLLPVLADYETSEK